MSHNTLQRLAIGLCLVVLLTGVYFITYNGYATSRDEWFLFDATESMAQRGNLRLNYQADAYSPISLDDSFPPVADTEPLQPILAAPLFLMAQALPGIGLVHAVWLFNILITALTAGTLYLYGLALGYRVPVALLVGLAFGLGTIAWPYSRTFFREPLFTWLALLSALLMMRLRQKLSASERPWFILAGLGLALAGVLFSKEASFLIIPALLVEAIPSRLGRVRITRNLVVTLIALAVLGTVLGYLILFSGIGPSRYAFDNRLQQVQHNVSAMSEGVRGYLYSPARSLWVFSPILLLGFLGWPRLIHEHRWRQIAMPLTALVAFILGYAAVRGPEWYGGTGWGPRYLVPVTPFAALWLLPVTEYLLSRGASWLARIGAGLLMLLSAGIQILAALVPLNRYYETLGSQQPPVLPWKEGAWSWRWSPFRVYWELLGHQKIDLAWNYVTRGQAWLLPALSMLLILLALSWIGWWLRRRRTCRAFVITAGSLAAMMAATFGGGLYAIRLDPRYFGDFQPTRDLLRQLEPQLRSGDVVVLNDFTYTKFFMNYYKAEPVVFTLLASPGERGSAEQTPEIESQNPEDLMHLSNTLILSYLANRHDRVWLVINSSQFIPWSTRPVERYLAQHYFPVGEIAAADIARALLFSTTSAPPATVSAWPEHAVEVTFGESLKLDGYDLPGGMVYHAGDVLPVSLLWETLVPVPQDYTVGVFLMSLNGELHAQHDSFPEGGFEHTQTWRVGSLHRDNHGLALPETLPPGEYDLWVVVYWWQKPGERLAVIDASGRSQGDHSVLTRVRVQ
jgi:hypothetical protein